MEGYLDGQDIHRQVFRHATQADGVFLSGEDDFALALHVLKCVGNARDVTLGVVVVVGKTHVLQFAVAAQFVNHGLGVRDAGDGEYAVDTAQVNAGRLPVEGLYFAVLQVREEDLLVVLQLEVVDDIVLLDGVEARGAFGDYHDAGAVAAAAELAQVAIRQDVILKIRVAVLGEEYVDAGLDAAVLEDIVEHHKFQRAARLFLFISR